jgi:hypothetical protein
MAVLTQRDLGALVAEIRKFTEDDPATVDGLVGRASSWMSAVAAVPGFGDLLVRDVTALCAYARMSDVETRRMAAGALALVLQEQAASEVLVGRHMAVSVALQEIRRRRGDAPGQALLAVSPEERRLAESIFLGHAEAPLYPDNELARRATTLCDELAHLAGATFVAHLIMGTRLLVEVLRSPSHDYAQTWARAGLSYVLRQDDATDDRLGLVGLLDDLYVVETAVRFIQPGRAPLDAILRELFSAWPFLLDVVLAEGDDTQPASEFLLLNLAFACPDLLGNGAGFSRLAVTGPGTGPIPLLVGLLAGLGEQQRRTARPSDRFVPGQLVLVNGGPCAVYRGRRHDQAGAPKIVLEFPSHSKRGGPVKHMLHLWAESCLTPAPADRRPSGEMPRLGQPEARPVGVLQRLFHLDEPMIPNPAAKKVLVVGDRLKARALATSVLICGQPLVEVLPMGHLNRRGEICSWSQSAFGAQQPLIVISSVPERAAAFVEDRASDVAVVIIDGDGAESAGAEMRRLVDAQVPVLAFLRDDDGGAQTAALLADCGARVWRWRADDLHQMQWRSSRGSGPIAAFEQRVEASSGPDIRTISVDSAQVSEAFECLRSLGSPKQDDDEDQVQPLVGQAWSIGLQLVRSVAVLDAPSALGIRDRIGRIERALASDRFASVAEKAGLAKVMDALGRLTADLERENPKGEALAGLLKDAPELAVLSDVPRDACEVRPMRGAVVTHWLGKARMPRILMPPVALPLYLLLYAPERRWLRGYMEAARRSCASPPDDNERRVVFPGVASAWGSGTTPPPLPPQEEQPQTPDLDEIRVAVLRGRARHLLARAGLQGGELVDARMVVFREQAYAFLTEGYDANVVTHLLSPQHSEPAEVKVRRPEQLKIGDVVIFPDGDRDAIRAYADRTLPTGERERAKLWQRALRRWKDGLGLTTRTITEMLHEHGCARHPLTVRNWIVNDNLIGPGRRGDIRALASLTGDPELAAHVEDCERAVSAVRGEHLRAAGKLAEMIAERAATTLAGAGGEPVKLDDVYVVTVEHLGDRLEQVPRGAANRLIFDAGSADSGEDPTS